MSQARNFADLLASGTTITSDKLDDNAIHGNRNLIINGACTISQRGTSETGITSGGYKNAPDRFKFELSSLGTWTASQSTDAPDGFSNSYKLECTTADASPSADDFCFLQHFIEAQNLQHLKYGTSGAKNLTLSFWVKSNKTGTYGNYLYRQDALRIYSYSYTINTANTWEYKTINISGDTTGAIANDNGRGIRISFTIGTGSNRASGSVSNSWESYTNKAQEGLSNQVNLADTVGNTWQITGVQLEVGEATPFEHRSYGDELRRCQRYYYENPAFIGVGLGSSVIARATATHPTSMRASPSLTIAGSPEAFDGSGGLVVTGVSSNYSNTILFNADLSNTGSGSSGRAVCVAANLYTSSNKIKVDAEL